MLSLVKISGKEFFNSFVILATHQILISSKSILHFFFPFFFWDSFFFFNRITTKKTELDVASNTLTYRIFRSPQGCAKGRADDGIASFPGSAEFNVLTKSGATPTLVPGKLQTLKTLNCEG